MVEIFMKIKVITDINEFKEYRLQWNNILEKMNNTNPFLDFDLICTWWSYFGQDKRLFIIVIIKDIKIIGFSQFMINKKAIGEEINFIGFPQYSYNDFVVEAKYKKYFINKVMEYLFNHSYLISLNGLSEDSDTINLIKDYLIKDKVKFSTSVTPAYFIEKHAGFKEYYKGLNSGQIRNIDKREKRLKKLGCIEYRKIDDENLEEIFNLHDKRWMKKNDTSNFSVGNTKEFFKEVCLNKKLSFEVSVKGLYLNNRIIAYEYGFKLKDRYVYYRVCHDDDYYIYSPGKIITKYIIKTNFDKEINYFDFGIGYEEYKTYWTDSYKNIYKIVFSTNKLSLNYKISKTKENFIKSLKKNYKFVMFIRNTLGKIKYYLSFRNIKNIKITEYARKIISVEDYRILEINLNHLNYLNDLYPIKKCNIDEIDLITEMTNKKKADLIKMFYYGFDLFLKYDNNKLHYMFWTKKNIKLPEINYNENLNDDSLFIYDIYFNEKYSNKNNINEILSYIKQRGFKRCYLKTNKKSSKILRGLDYRQYMRKSYIRFLDKYLKGFLT